MNEKLKINGIRLNKNFIQLTQEQPADTGDSCVPLYQFLEAGRINMVFMTFNTLGHPFVSGTIAAKQFGQISVQMDPLVCHHAVWTISIYPHSYRLRLLGFILSLLGRQKALFQDMVSSSSMLTLVADQAGGDAIIRLLADGFDLPRSHVPFEPGENEELSQFLKKKFPETRATYVEQKIKTYGIALASDLALYSYRFSLEQLADYGEQLSAMAEKEDTFAYVSAHRMADYIIHLTVLTQKILHLPSDDTSRADMVSFHGPHFGDRHSIVSRALRCLSEQSIPVFQVGCTGASISMVLPQGKGTAAKKALMDVFEVP